MDEALVEVVAAAVGLVMRRTDWTDECVARAAISAIRASGIAKVAPVVATEGMIAEAWIKRTSMDNMPSPQEVFAAMWSAMISAVEG